MNEGTCSLKSVLVLVLIKRSIVICAAIRRYEAAAWLRKVVGVVGARDLPAEPSEEEFRLGLRSGIILCNVLNKIQEGAVLKVSNICISKKKLIPFVFVLLCRYQYDCVVQ